MTTKTKKKVGLSEARLVHIFHEMNWYRGEFIDEKKFCKMSDVWETYERDVDEVKIKEFNVDKEEDGRVARVVEFAGRFTLIVPSSMMDKARAGDGFSNFQLAHEFSHVALGHHEHGAGKLYFRMTKSERFGYSDQFDDPKEIEASIAAVFFQCGISLLAPDVSASFLAQRAFSDYKWVKRALIICRSTSFQNEMHKYQEARKNVPREVF